MTEGLRVDGPTGENERVATGHEGRALSRASAGQALLVPRLDGLRLLRTVTTTSAAAMLARIPALKMSKLRK